VAVAEVEAAAEAAAGALAQLVGPSPSEEWRGSATELVSRSEGQQPNAPRAKVPLRLLLVHRPAPRAQRGDGSKDPAF